ncbi:MAG: hypothetical protein ACI9EZ_000508 [Halobacteriales archaeon]|jgi:hypothetical protein
MQFVRDHVGDSTANSRTLGPPLICCHTGQWPGRGRSCHCTPNSASTTVAEFGVKEIELSTDAPESSAFLIEP